MTDIAEIMARAMCTAQGLDWDAQSSFLTNANGDDDGQEFYHAAAQAALTALQERGFVVIKQADIKRINAKADAIIANMLAASPGSSVKE